MSDKKLTSSIFGSEAEYNDHQKSLSRKEEWPGVNIKAVKDSRVTLNTPMLIMELHRLVPYKEGCYIHFHPFNMPYIKIHKIELVGLVTNIKHTTNNLFLTIEDGTGVIEIHYKLQHYMSMLEQRRQIDERYRNQAENLKKSNNETKVVETKFKNLLNKFPDPRPGFSYSHDTCLQDIAILENKWWLETNNGLLGKTIELFDYVYVIGYPCLDAKFQNIPEKITAEFIERAKLTVFALSITCISEETYNKKLSTWISTTVCQRYKEKENYTVKNT